VKLPSNESSQTQDINKDTKSPDNEVKRNHMKEPFTNFYSSRTNELHSIGIGIGDQFSLRYYYLTPLIHLERIKETASYLLFINMKILSKSNNVRLNRKTPQTFICGVIIVEPIGVDYT